MNINPMHEKKLINKIEKLTKWTSIIAFKTLRQKQSRPESM